MMNSEIGFGRKVLQVFEDNGLSFEHMPSGIDTLTVYVHQSEFEEKEQNIISGLHRAVAPDAIDLEEVCEETEVQQEESSQHWHISMSM